MASARLDLSGVDAVVFDLDGTLYEQAPLRRRMLVELALHVATRPWRVGLLRRLQTFRRVRERLGDEEATDVARLQYERPAALLGISSEALRAEVEEWIERRPLRHLGPCRVVGARRFFEELRAAGVRLGVLSDYPVVEKLAALGLEADEVASGVDRGIERLKPHPASLRVILERLECSPERALMVGDRDDRDGECARRAGVRCLLRKTDFETFVELLRA